MSGTLPELAPYPTDQVLKSLDRATFDSVISSWAALIQFYVVDSAGRYPNSLRTFIESYIHGSAKAINTTDVKSTKVNSSKQQRKGKERDTSHTSNREASLRSGVFTLVTSKHIIPRPTPEFVWDFISLYGPKNVAKTIQYVKYLDKSFPVMITKLSKLAVHTIKNSNNVSSDTILKTIAILIIDPELSTKFLTDNWYAELYSVESDLAMQVISLCQNGVSYPGPGDTNRKGKQRMTTAQSPSANPEDISMLLDLFPDLNIKSANKVLASHSSVETATAYLLENENAFDGLESDDSDEDYSVSDADSDKNSSDEEIKRYQPLANKKANKQIRPSNPDTAALEATLRLIYEADEDERDDTYDDAPRTEEEAASTAALMKIEKQLWQIYNSTPDIFKRESRKAKQRLELRKVTGWTDEQIEGWARIIEKNPRRKAYLEERFMFQGNLPHMRHAALKRVQSNDNGSLSTPVTEDDTDHNDSDEPISSEPAPQSHSKTHPPDANRSKQQIKNQRQRSDKYKSIQRQRQKDKHSKKMGLE
ncbi:Cue3p [Sugiyamaella lignohabitans]|uniref:Cue3p n=1 Tax=Sugiyamaella lignohabitans TaxID=796027 RepID=A0A167DQW9_9ASCO|nr:Cue3p [Sugiyamaella lignohabitans]ANB13184.1 Cue3p [Sugiyamaella lignohabitans]